MKHLVFILCTIFLLFGCSNDPNSASNAESKVMIENKKEKFSEKVTFDYYVSENSPLYGKDKYYTFHYVSARYGGYYTAFALDKTKDGYKFLHGNDKGFVISEKGGMGYTNVVLIDKPLGTFTIYFESKGYYEAFYRGNPTEMYWDDAATVRKKENKKSNSKN